MVDVGGGDVDDFEKCCCKLKIVSRSVEKLVIPSNLNDTHMSVMKCSGAG